MAKGILTSLHGRLSGLDADGRLLAPGGLTVGGEGQSPIVLPGGLHVAFFDDFNGASVAYSTTPLNGWRSRKGTTNAVDWTLTAPHSIQGTLGDTTASMAVSGIQFDRGLDWKANQGNVTIEARVKLGKIATIAMFFGFTNQVAALQMPIQSAASADTFTSNAADATGFMFDTSMTTKNWWLVGNAASVAPVAVNTALAPVAATYEVLRIELDTLGNATFYRNNKRIGRLALAVTPTVALTPVIAAFNRATATDGTCIVTADYFALSGMRV